MKNWCMSLLFLSLSAFGGMTVGTFNIRNFDYDERSQIHTNKPMLKDLIGSLKADLLGVNEINQITEFEKFMSQHFPQYDVQLSTCGGAHGQRLGFVFNKTKLKLLSFNEDLSVSIPGEAGGCNTGSRPLAIAAFESIQTKTKFYAIQVHLKSGGQADSMATRAKQYKIIANVINQLRAGAIKEFVVMGDFNTTGYLLRDSDYNEFTAMNKNAKLNDLSEKVGCTAYWWGGSEDGIETPSLLDHVLVSPALAGTSGTKVHSHCQKVSCNFASPTQLGQTYEQVSDHCPQTATLR
jgi:endonuclease/exonuclease/phosphatase family metal-dependent hydrolase